MDFFLLSFLPSFFFFYYYYPLHRQRQSLRCNSRDRIIAFLFLGAFLIEKRAKLLRPKRKPRHFIIFWNLFFHNPSGKFISFKNDFSCGKPAAGGWRSSYFHYFYISSFFENLYRTLTIMILLFFFLWLLWNL